MRIPLFLLTSLAFLAACNGDDENTTETGTPGDDDDDTVTGDDDDDTTTVDACEVSGNVCTWLGVAPVPDQGLFFAGFSAEGLPRTNPPQLWLETTLLYLPVDITFAPDGTAYYADYNNHRIRKIELDGSVHTLSGTGLLGDGPNDDGSVTNCWGGCDSLVSAWNHPTDVTINPDAPNELWISAWHNSRLTVVDEDSGLTTWKVCNGGRQYGAADVDLDGSFLDDCVMDLPSSIAFSSDGSIYFSDQANHLIRKVDLATNTISVVAGEPRKAGIDGDGGPAALAHLHGMTDQKADPGSKLVIHDDVLYMADTLNGVIRTIDLATGIIDTVAGKFVSSGTGMITDGATGAQYEADLGAVTGYSGDGGPALEAVMNTPRDIAVGIDGELYIADTKNNCVRVVRDGVIDRFAGRCGEPESFGGDEGPALDANFGNVFGVATDPEGNVYVTDTNHHIIRRVKH
jgi:DNA-binding beta-propeller fold protein YncE